jgi:hypothetical protein
VQSAGRSIACLHRFSLSWGIAGFRVLARILLAFRIGGIFGWRVHVESERRPIASICKLVFRAWGDDYKVADIHQGTLAVDLRGHLSLDYQEHLIAILVILRLLAGGLPGLKFHHSNLTTLGSFQDLEPLGFSKYIQVAHRSSVFLPGFERLLAS